MKRMIIYGNCQAWQLTLVLSRLRQVTDRWQISCQSCTLRGDELDRAVAEFADADLLIQQDISDWQRHPLCGRLPPDLRVVRFPFFYVGALWPFDAFVQRHGDPFMLRAMQAFHANNPGVLFPFHFHDQVLGDMRATIPDPVERLRRYRALDFPQAANIGRHFVHELARLDYDDRRLGVRVGAYFRENYRDTRLFHAITHPAAVLVERIAADVLEQLGLGDVEIAPGAESSAAEYQVPIHPKVAEMLGLRWADATTRYRQINGEFLTFDEYFERYVNVADPAEVMA